MKNIKLLIVFIFVLCGNIVAHPESNRILVTQGAWGDIFWDHPFYKCWHQLRFCLEKQGYFLQQINSIGNQEDFKVIISNEIADLILPHPKEKLILLIWEPPTVQPLNYDKHYHEPFSKILTWNDDLVDNKRYFKFYYPFYEKMIKDVVDFDKKKYVC